LFKESSATAPNGKGVLVIDEHGDRKWGKKTAHVGKQWLANIGKTENGVVSVSSLWADEGVYYPLEVEPYTPKHHFEGGRSDPRFRTKLKIAGQLVERSVAMGVPFRAVVADSFYGENEDFERVLSGLVAPHRTVERAELDYGRVLRHPCLVPELQTRGLSAWTRTPNGVTTDAAVPTAGLAKATS
jgi:hypothetical protein